MCYFGMIPKKKKDVIFSSDFEILSLDLSFTYLSLGSASLVSRICLASQYDVVHVDRYRGQYDPTPGVWLNIKHVRCRTNPGIQDQCFYVLYFVDGRGNLQQRPVLLRSVVEAKGVFPILVRLFGSQDGGDRDVGPERQCASFGHTPKEGSNVVRGASNGCPKVIYGPQPPGCLPKVRPDSAPPGEIQVRHLWS